MIPFPTRSQNYSEFICLFRIFYIIRGQTLSWLKQPSSRFRAHRAILHQIARSFLPRLRKNIPQLSVSSEYFISWGDRSYSTSKAPITLQHLYLRGTCFFWWDQSKRNNSGMSGLHSIFSFRTLSSPRTLAPDSYMWFVCNRGLFAFVCPPMATKTHAIPDHHFTSWVVRETLENMQTDQSPSLS